MFLLGTRRRRRPADRALPAGVLLPVALLAALLAGCATPHGHPGSVDGEAGSVELHGTPFFPQRRHQCGPAALATVLAASGAPVALDALTGQVYLPGRRGSLQLELLAAARAADRLPYLIEGSLDAILAELHAGRPVLVMQNLGVAWIPRWHYAVVVGVDTARGEVILRSGTARRRRTPLPLFLRTWARSGAWGFVVLTPGALPADPVAERYFSAAAAFEATGRPEAAAAAWRTARAQWPASPVPRFGLANLALARGDAARAAALYRQVLTTDPAFVEARNNLAHALAGQQRIGEALAVLEEALRSPQLDPRRRAMLEDSRREIAVRRGADRTGR